MRNHVLNPRKTAKGRPGPSKGRGPSDWARRDGPWATRAQAIGTPLLVMHGGADSTVAPSHALRLASALQALDRPYELKIFAGEGHVIAGRAAERDADAVRWSNGTTVVESVPAPAALTRVER